MPRNSLESLLQSAANPVAMLRNSQTGPNVYPVMKAEYTNWRDEQRAWQQSCVLFNQSYHMSDLYVKGPDAFRFLNSLGINSFNNFSVDKAKQYVCCNYDGYVIGDVILFYLEENLFSLVGRPPLLNWVQFHAENSAYDIELEWDHRAADQKNGLSRKYYRYQIQGPNAMKVIEKVTGQPAPALKFFNMTRITIAGNSVRALRHGMAGQPGFELFGPYAEHDVIMQALISAGDEFGLHLVGGRAYSSNTLESGWIPSPMPAVYSGEKMKAFREWLPANGFEAVASLGGSFVSENIEDYYLTPYELGYGFFVKFDHEFIGREALEQLAQQPQRRKVTLALNPDDVINTIASMYYKDEERAKFIDYPSAVYAMYPYDKVMVDDKLIGLSTWVGYSSNERSMLTLAMVDEQYAEPGTQVSFVWGEENGGTAKPTVESHKQVTIRATVSPVPYAEVARTQYVKGNWRNQNQK
ncbi:MAG: hypothetical protein WD601_04940 [Pseudohongiellaceae bacterium]